MSALNESEKMKKKCDGTLIKRETLGSMLNKTTSSTYSQKELQNLIKRYYPHYAGNSDGGKKE